MLFISPPFGNYIRLPGTIPIRGSFTLERREGLVGQVMRTLRYSWEHKGWINKIGLRNQGIDHAIRTYKPGTIISLAVLKPSDISEMKRKVPDTMDIEINVSCPNTDKKMVSQGLSVFLTGRRKWCIVKLSPLTKEDEIDEFYSQGFRQFHCSNTLPIEGRGGLSGESLRPYTTKLVKYIKETYPDSTIIAGGGIKDICDVHDYRDVGANHMSVSTVCFRPIKLAMLYGHFLAGNFKKS